MEFCKAVQPDTALLHRAVEAEFASPHVRRPGIGLCDIGQYQCTVALLHQSHAAREGTACQGVGVVFTGDIIVVVVALHPTWCIVNQHRGRVAVLHADRHVVGLAEDGIVGIQLFVQVQHAAVAYLLTLRHRQCRRGLGDALQLTHEVAHVGRLVVAAHLPHHSVAVLHVVPQRIVAVLRGDGRRVDAYLVVAGTHHHLLAPVAQDVTLIAGGALGVVIGLRAGEGLDESLSVFIDTAGSILSVGIVKRFVEQVAIPVDAHVLRHTTLRCPRDDIAIDGTDDTRVAR